MTTFWVGFLCGAGAGLAIAVILYGIGMLWAMHQKPQSGW